MAKKVKSASDGIQPKKRWFRNPGKTGKQYCEELHVGASMKTGEVLSDRQKAYRAGYTAARADSGHAYAYRKTHPKD